MPEVDHGGQGEPQTVAKAEQPSVGSPRVDHPKADRSHTRTAAPIVEARNIPTGPQPQAEPVTGRQPKAEPIRTERASDQRSLLSQSVESQLLPPERFQSEQRGEIVDIKRIDETIAALRKVDGHYEVTIFDAQGRPTTVLLDPSSRVIANNTTKDYVPYRSSDNYYNDSISDILYKAGYAKDEAKKFEAQWASDDQVRRLGASASYQGIHKERLAQLRTPIIFNIGDWNVETRTDPNTGQEMFVFNLGDKTHRGLQPNAPKQFARMPDETYKALPDPSAALHGDMVLDRGSTLFKITDQDGRVLGSYGGQGPIVNPTNPTELYFINTGQIYKLDLSGVRDRSAHPVLERQIDITDPQELRIDPNGNFLIIRSGDQKLVIVDREGGDVVRSFDNVQGPIMVDAQGDIIFADTQGKLREIQTNFQAIPSGGSESAKGKREEDLRKMQERFAGLDLDSVERQKSDTLSEEDVANTLRDSIAKQVTDRITAATDPEQVEEILDRLQGLKGDPSNQGYEPVIDEFVGQARDKLSGIRTAELDSRLTVFAEGLEGVEHVGDTIGLDEQFAKLLELRQKVDITDLDKRREIEQRIRTIQTQKDMLIGQYQGELVQTVQDTFPSIEELIREAGSTQELGAFGTTLPAQQFEMMLANIRDPQLRRELRERYKQVKTEQRDRLEQSGREFDEQQRLRWAQVVDEAREDLSSLQAQIEDLADTKDIDRFGRDPLVTAWRAKLYTLPPELLEIEEKRLELIMGSRKKDIEHRRELGAVGEAGELQFGNTTFPVFKEPPTIWQPKLTPKGGIGTTQWAELTFEDAQGRVFRPKGEEDTLVNAAGEDRMTQDVIARYRTAAEEHFRGLKRQVPEFSENWRITDFHKGRLEEVAEALKLQLANHRGILILQGEAGTGKNVLVDMLANLADREIVSVACNENTIKEDLTYEFFFDPQRGTYKLPSRMIEGLQTPGTVILFDEINALRPGIGKMLNSLFDYRRRIFVPDSGGGQKEIITDPTVLFVGTMNPQNYAGVNRLSPEVKSRSRVVDIDYPPFEEMRGGRTFYRSDEAEMLAAYMDDLSGLQQQEFKQCWDYVINRDTTNGADAILSGNQTFETDIRRIHDVVRVANRLREMYAAYQIGDSNEPMDFPTSLREVTDIVMEMNHRKGVKPMIKRVIVPKIDDRRQKRIVEQTIDALLPD